MSSLWHYKTSNGAVIFFTDLLSFLPFKSSCILHYLCDSSSSLSSGLNYHNIQSLIPGKRREKKDRRTNKFQVTLSSSLKERDRKGRRHQIEGKSQLRTWLQKKSNLQRMQSNLRVRGIFYTAKSHVVFLASQFFCCRVDEKVLQGIPHPVTVLFIPFCALMSTSRKGKSLDLLLSFFAPRTTQFIPPWILNQEWIGMETSKPCNKFGTF